MDSLTQVVLGASVGEICLGKKIGNRAMLWGAVAGTIPDLDVIGNIFMTKAESLAFHRGISHSFFFSITAAFVFAWLLDKLYKKPWHLSFEKWLSSGLMAFIAVVLFAIGVMLKPHPIRLAVYLIIVGAAWYQYQKRIRFSYSAAGEAYSPSYLEWYTLFFFGFVTHILLDSFTAYGTQLFAPFSNTRVSFDNISVADLFYTTPFLIGLISSSLQHESKKRAFWNYLGLTVSSLYMIWTIYHRQQIKTVLENTIIQEQIDHKGYTLIPSILQNVLWSATVESDDSFYHGTYSIFDREARFKLNKVAKNQTLIADAREDDETIQILKWFTNGYYMCLVREDGKTQLNDMRYGTFRGERYTENDFIFKFVLEKDDMGYYQITNEAGRPTRKDREAMMPELIKRIKGI